MKYASRGTVAFLLCLLVLAASSSQAQIARENPGSLTSLSPYGADMPAAGSSVDLFTSMDGVVTSLGSGDFNVSRDTLKSLMASDSDFAELVRQYNLSDEQGRVIADQLNMTAGEMGAMIESSEAYYRDYAAFDAYLEAGDDENATLAATRLQDQYASLNMSARAITDHSTAIRDRLADDHADTGSIERFLASLDNYTAMVASDNQRPYTLAGGGSFPQESTPLSTEPSASQHLGDQTAVFYGVRLTDIVLPLVVLVLALGGVLLAVRRLFRDRLRRGAPVPEPAPSSHRELPPEEQQPLPDLSFEEEIASINRSISDGGNARDSIIRIYQALRRLVDSHGLTVEKSDTHRDLARKLYRHNPSLEIPTDTILFYYEYAVFGHYLPNGQDVANALHCFREIHSTMSGGSRQ